MVDWRRVRSVLLDDPERLPELLRPILERLLHRSKPWRQLASLLANDAQDIVQEALLDLTTDRRTGTADTARLRAACASEDPTAPERLAQTIVTRRAYDQVRRSLRLSRGIAENALEQLQVEHESPPDPFLDERFRSCLTTLDRGPREKNCASLMRHQAWGRSVADIALLVGRPDDVSSLQQRVRYCREKLAECLGRKKVNIDEFLS